MKAKKIIYLLFVIALCFLFKENVYAVTAPSLDITRFNYSSGDLKITEGDEMFKTRVGKPMQLYAIIDYGNDMDVPDTGASIGDWIVSSADLQGVTWTSSNTSVATINADGLLTPVTAGSTTVTAKYTKLNSSEQLTATKNITIMSTCDNLNIAQLNISYNIYFSTGQHSHPEPAVIETNSNINIDDYKFPTITTKKLVYSSEGYDLGNDKGSYYVFSGWYSDKSFNENKKVNKATDLNYFYVPVENSCNWKSYSVAYAKWISESEIGGSKDDTIAVEDTAASSNLYIFIVSLLLLMFGISIVIISLKDNIAKTQ